MAPGQLVSRRSGSRGTAAERRKQKRGKNKNTHVSRFIISEIKTFSLSCPRVPTVKSPARATTRFACTVVGTRTSPGGDRSPQPPTPPPPPTLNSRTVLRHAPHALGFRLRRHRDVRTARGPRTPPRDKSIRLPAAAREVRQRVRGRAAVCVRTCVHYTRTDVRCVRCACSRRADLQRAETH